MGSPEAKGLYAFAFALALAWPVVANATPPPPPPVSPEVEAAADAAAAAFPLERMLEENTRLHRPGAISSLGRVVADHLMQFFVRTWPKGVDRNGLKDRFRERVSAELPALVPAAAAYIRRGISWSIRYHFTLEELVDARSMLERPAGAKLLYWFWANDDWDQGEMYGPFAVLLRDRVDELMAAAADDQKRRDRGR